MYLHPEQREFSSRVEYCLFSNEVDDEVILQCRLANKHLCTMAIHWSCFSYFDIFSMRA